MSRAARKRVWTAQIRPLTADQQFNYFIDHENDVRIVRVDTTFAELSGASEDETLQVGTLATPALYVSYVVADSQAAGTRVAHTLLSTALLPAGTVLMARKATAGADAASTALLHVSIHYEIIDRAHQP